MSAAASGAILLAAGSGLLALAAALATLAQSALARASRPAVQERTDAGDPRAAVVLGYLDTRERLVDALRFGRVAATAAGASLATAFAMAVGWVPAAAALVVALAWLALVEIVPRLAGAARPEAVALGLAPLLPAVDRSLGAAAKTLDGLVARGLALLGLERGPNANAPEEEIRERVDLLAKEGAVDAEARLMMGGLLDLVDLTVADVMVHRTKMQTLDAASPMPEVVRAALDSPFSRLPVRRDAPDDIIGVLHVKALFRALDAGKGDPSGIDLADLLTPPWFVPDTTTLADQLRAFLRRRAHIALVVDEYGEVMGLLTLEDIIEEIVGDIADETDVEVPGLRVQGDGSVAVDGQAAIRDVNRAMNWDLPDDEATTVAGLVIHEARMIPEPGQSFTFHGFVFAVVKRERNRLTRLRITPKTEARRPAVAP
jgi:Mg2+/Co2+ transporter CorB